MSRRIVAPVLLLLAAALSIAAVFVVHDIESAGGPLSEPSAIPPYFSPNGDGVQDTVEISFTTRRPERITVRIEYLGGGTVETLVDNKRIDGEHSVSWNGIGGGAVITPMPDSTYRAVLTREGDRREYEPTERIVLDTKAPSSSRIDRISLVGGQLQGLALLEPGVELVFVHPEFPDGFPDARMFQPRDPDARGARPDGPRPAGTVPIRFVVPSAGKPTAGLRIFAVDPAGNRSELHANIAVES